MRLQSAVYVHVSLERGLGAEVGVADAAEEGAAVARQVDAQEVRVEEAVTHRTGTPLLVSRERVVLVAQPGRFERRAARVTLVADRQPTRPRVCRGGHGPGQLHESYITVSRITVMLFFRHCP